MAVLNFIILYIKLLPPFLAGVKNGCKFRGIDEYAKEDKEIDAADVVLPDGDHQGRIGYNASPNKSDMTLPTHAVTNQSHISGAFQDDVMRHSRSTHIGSSSPTKHVETSIGVEEVKMKGDAQKERNNLYQDDAI